jgi:hypothetical protein
MEDNIEDGYDSGTVTFRGFDRGAASFWIEWICQNDVNG